MSKSKERVLIEETFGEPLLENPLLSDKQNELITQKAPQGWENVVKKMKSNKKIKNPWALAWYLKNNGYKPK